MSTNKNLKYQASNTASIFALKNAHNAIANDFAELGMYNICINGDFRLFGSNIPYGWLSSAVFTPNMADKYITATFQPNDYIVQHIHSSDNMRIKSNTNYTAVVYANVNASGIVFEVDPTDNYQIDNLNNPLEVNNASTNLTDYNIMSKYVLNFKTRTISNGNIYIRLKNNSASPITIYIESIELYEGLVEVSTIKTDLTPAYYLYNQPLNQTAYINDSSSGNSVLWTSNKIISQNSCKAWVNFDGTASDLTAGIRDSFNVELIGSLGAGQYRIYFRNHLSSVNYAVLGTANYRYVVSPFEQQTDYCTIYVYRTTTEALTNVDNISISIVGN